MTASFRMRRYLVALLWSWSIPMMVGFALGGIYIGYTNLVILEAADKAFVNSIEAVVESCTAPTDSPPSRSPPASGTGPPVAGDGGDTG